MQTHRGRTLVVLLVGLSTSGLALAAHHSFSAFNMETEATITGVVKQVDWTNPHIWIWIDVTNEDGGADTWGLEGMSPNYLERRGWTRTTLEAGDEVTVRFRPMKNGEHGGMFVSTTLGDGTILSMGGASEG
jgi:hypothetical protein